MFVIIACFLLSKHFVDVSHSSMMSREFEFEWKTQPGGEQEDLKYFQLYLAKQGKSYPTQAEFNRRLKNF